MGTVASMLENTGRLGMGTYDYELGRRLQAHGINSKNGGELVKPHPRSTRLVPGVSAPESAVSVAADSSQTSDPEVLTEYTDDSLELVLEACERIPAHLTAAVVSNDPRFQNKVVPEVTSKPAVHPAAPSMLQSDRPLLR